MGLLDSLGLGDALKGALGQVEAAALPALINGVLAKTQYHDLNGLVTALQERQRPNLPQDPVMVVGPGANTCRSPRISSKRYSVTLRCRNLLAISDCPSIRHWRCWRSFCPISSTRRRRTAR